MSNVSDLGDTNPGRRSSLRLLMDSAPPFAAVGIGSCFLLVYNPQLAALVWLLVAAMVVMGDKKRPLEDGSYFRSGADLLSFQYRCAISIAMYSFAYDIWWSGYRDYRYIEFPVTDSNVVWLIVVPSVSSAVFIVGCVAEACKHEVRDTLEKYNLYQVDYSLITQINFLSLLAAYCTYKIITTLVF